MMLSLISALIYALPDPERSLAARAILVAGYTAAAWLWWRAAQSKRTGDSSWWRLGAILLLLLALNKFFNLRLVFEAGIRAIAKAGHWYERRRPVQFFVAIVLPSILAVITAVFVAIKGRRFFRPRRIAFAGWVMLLLYLVLRQSQEWKPVLPWLEAMHYHDWRLALEAGGIMLVITASLL
jgi:hypothetical protein